MSPAGSRSCSPSGTGQGRPFAEPRRPIMTRAQPRRSALDLVAERRSVAWDSDNGLLIIDQTLLPARPEMLRLATVAQVEEAIRSLRVRGAPAIGLCGAYGVVVGLMEREPADLRKSLAALAEVAEHIGSARPTAVNLSWAVARVRAAAERGHGPAEVRVLALAEAERIRRENRDACQRLAEHGRAELAGIGRVLTHCNTGWLATAEIGSALGVVYQKAAHGEPVAVLACETRPLLQGSRLTVWELLAAGIDVTLLPDGAGPWALATGQAEAVLVGADRIARNGDTANKIGTYAHALAAHAAGVPFYVAAPLSSFDQRIASGAAIAIELRAATEVRGFPTAGASAGAPVAPEDARAWNPAFDITPATLISAFITERGVLRPPFEQAIAEALQQP